MYNGGLDGVGEVRELKYSGPMTTIEKRSRQVSGKSGKLRAAVPLRFQQLSLPVAELLGLEEAAGAGCGRICHTTHRRPSEAHSLWKRLNCLLTPQYFYAVPVLLHVHFRTMSGMIGGLGSCSVGRKVDQLRPSGQEGEAS